MKAYYASYRIEMEDRWEGLQQGLCSRRKLLERYGKEDQPKKTKRAKSRSKPSKA
jgi:hypothetical protein